MRATVFSTRLGWIAICWRKGRVAALSFGQTTESAACEALLKGRTADERAALEWWHARDLTASEAELVQRLEAYANGQPDDFADVSLDLGSRTEFERRVIRSCRRVGYGRTTTYGELAEKAGAPRAARAVGNVMRKNSLPLIIPCHRVLAAGNALGGYSAPEGLTMKKRLLRLEAEA